MQCKEMKHQLNSTANKHIFQGENILSLTKLDLLVLLCQDLCELCVTLANKVKDQVPCSIIEHSGSGR